jgi:hypothetical protein
VRGGSNGGNFETLVTFTANICHSAESCALTDGLSCLLILELIREMIKLLDLTLDLRERNEQVFLLHGILIGPY